MGAGVERVLGDPEVFRVRIPFANLGAGRTNCYMLHDAGEWLVVDVGAPGVRGRRALVAAFAEAGVDFSACRVFLTHGHFDHAGLLAEAVSARVEAFLSEAAFDLRQPALRAAVHDRFLRRMLAAGASEDDARGYAAANAEAVAFEPGARPWRFVREGDVLSVGRYSFSVVGTAGHTPDHLALYEPRCGVLFGGDHVLMGAAPSVDAFPGSEDGLGLYLANLRKAADLPVRTTLPGHGEPIFGSLGPRAAEIARRKEERCEDVRAAVARLPECGLETLARTAVLRAAPETWRRLRPMARYYALLEAFAAVQHLCAQGRVRRLPDEGCATWRYRVE